MARHSRQNKWPRVTFAALGVFSLAGIGFQAGSRLAALSHESTTSTTTPSSAPYLLSIGGSSSVGMQPMGTATHNGHLTADSYGNTVGYAEKRNNVYFEVYHDGCPGETAQSMIEINDGLYCNTHGSAPQLTRAITFLQQNQYRAGVVTIDIGFNDVRPCIKQVPVDEACVQRGLAFVRNDLPKVLEHLKAAAASNVTFVGLQYYDPFLERYLVSPAGVTAANASLAAINSLNAILATEYQAAGMKVADVPGLFQTQDNTPVKIFNVGTIPNNVYQVCLLTWMCQPKPFGPDDHPNNAGSMVIAEAIMAQLPGAWYDYPPK